MFYKKIIVTILLAGISCAHAFVGPTVQNNTTCGIEIDIESDCSGLVVGKSNIEPSESYRIPNKFEDKEIKHNEKFCFVLKPTCSDSVMQHIQTLAPFFHEKCFISYNEDAKGNKYTEANEACNSPQH